MLEERIAALAARVGERAAARGMTLGTAESCTGGLIAGAITAVAGSSAYFYGGIVSYDNSVKRGLLGVPQSVLDSVGAVSAECAAAMAEGARRALGVDIAVSVTGVAGPGGGTPQKPVGLVWFGLSTEAETRTQVCRFDGDRTAVRSQTVEHALSLLEEALEETDT